MKSVADISFVPGTPVLVRASLNVPLEGGMVTSSYRLRAAIPTILFLKEKGAKVIVCGHIGRSPTDTLAPIVEVLKEFIPKILFASSLNRISVPEQIRSMNPGDVLVLENLRKDMRETGNDVSYAEQLASYADFFVQDSFDACHRNHTSIVGVPKILPSYAGLSLMREIEHLSKARNPKSPSLAIFGGAKFATKIPTLKVLLPVYDTVFVGGAILHDIMYAKGFEIGKSLSSRSVDGVKEIINHPHLLLPIDVVANSGDGKRVCGIKEVQSHETIVDAGPETILFLEKKVSGAKTVLWNGPLGNYEQGFDAGDKSIIKSLARTKTFSVVGGGDTVASIEDMNLEDKISFISTGGGAMLQFLAEGTLPGIEALG